MGIWNNVKNRFGRGERYTGYRNRGDERYDDASEGYDGATEYDAYDEYGAYDSEGGYGQSGYGQGRDDADTYRASRAQGASSSSLRGYGVDRADYHLDDHAPLVTQSDVRSQPLLVTPAPGQIRDRIPQPRAYRRTASNLAKPEQADDSLAFKDGLARTPASFAQLQSERLRMETTGRIAQVQAQGQVQIEGPSQGQAQPSPYDQAQPSLQPSARPALRVVPQPSAQSSSQLSAQERLRVHRRIEQIRPVTYADAEQVAQELRKGVVVVLDLRLARPELAKRILDFSFGVASALEGQVDRHIDRVYIFSRNGSLTDEERASIRI